MTRPLPNAPGWWYRREADGSPTCVQTGIAANGEILINVAGDYMKVETALVPADWHGPFGTQEESEADAGTWMIDQATAVHRDLILLGGASINIVFSAPPGPGSYFLDVETDDGKSITDMSEWVERPDGNWALRITELPKPPTT